MKQGKYEYYQNQLDAARQIKKEMLDGNYPYLAAPTMSGKTGCLVVASALMLDYYLEHKIHRPQIVYGCMLSDLTVKQQTMKDLEEAFENGYQSIHGRFTGFELLNKENGIIKNTHHPDLRKIKIAEGGNLFSIFDECHERTNDGGLYEKALNGFKEGNFNWRWRAFSSATPYPFENMQSKFQKLKRVLLNPAETYYGILEYYYAKRLRQAGKFWKGGFLSPWATSKFIPDCVEKFKADGSGYVLIRKSGKRPSIFKKDLIHHMSLYNIEIEIKEFDSTLENIQDLELLLKSEPEKLTFVFIRGALRAGKRVSKKFIRGVLDTENVSNTASMIQSLVGRMSGNDVENRNFNIYCDIDHAFVHIQYWNDVIVGKELITIPSSNYNDTNLKREFASCRVSFHATFEAARDRAIEIGIKETFANYGKTAKVSSNNAHDLCNEALRGAFPSQRSPIYLVDGPSDGLVDNKIVQPRKESFNTSYYELVSSYGTKGVDVRDKFILFEPSVEKFCKSYTTEEPSENFISERRTRADITN